MGIDEVAFGSRSGKCTQKANKSQKIRASVCENKMQSCVSSHG